MDRLCYVIIFILFIYVVFILFSIAAGLWELANIISLCAYNDNLSVLYSYKMLLSIWLWGNYTALMAEKVLSLKFWSSYFEAATTF